MCIDMNVKYAPITCCGCNFRFAVPEDVKRRWQQNGDVFYCPSCKSGQSYRDNDLDVALRKVAKYKEQLEHATERSRKNWERYEVAERRRKAQKGVATRLKNKLKRGECPCCEQEFPDIKKHIEKEHPDFGLETDAKKKEQEFDVARRN